VGSELFAARRLAEAGVGLITIDAAGSAGDDLPSSGIDPEHEFLDFAGRPQRILAHGQPIRELL
jgi:hypothetical protein